MCYVVNNVRISWANVSRKNQLQHLNAGLQSNVISAGEFLK